MDISFARLQQLVAVAREGSFSAAAQSLGISQPALSRSIAHLEARYGVRIFERGRLGVTLTPAGAQILDEVEALLRHAHDLHQNLHLYKGGRVGSVSFGLSPQLGALLLLPVVLELFQGRPSLCVRSSVRSAPELLEGLIASEIEFFLCIDSQLETHPDVEFTQIGLFTPIYVVRSAHDLARSGRVNIADIEAYPFISAVEPPKEKTNGRAFNGLICDNYHLMRDIVTQSDFVFGCLREFVEADIAAGRLAELTVADFPMKPRAAFMAKGKHRTLSPLAEGIIDSVTRACSGELDGRAPPASGNQLASRSPCSPASPGLG